MNRPLANENERMSCGRGLVTGVWVLCAISLASLAHTIWVSARWERIYDDLGAKVKAMDSNFDDERVMDELAELMDKGRLEELESRCDDLIAERPMSPIGHCYKGYALYLAKKPTEAVPYLKEALRLSPGWRDTVQPYLEASGG